jgi:hypothetical protein
MSVLSRPIEAVRFTCDTGWSKTHISWTQKEEEEECEKQMM